MQDNILKKYKKGVVAKRDKDGYIYLSKDGIQYGHAGYDWVLAEEEIDQLAIFLRVENTIRIPKSLFIKVIEESKSQADYVVGWHGLLFGRFWSRIDHIETYVKCNRKTAKELMSLAIDKDVLFKEVDYSNKFLCGGAWMNSGFSSSGEHLEDWEFEVPPFVSIEEAKQEKLHAL